MIRTYTELCRIGNFFDRYKYLALRGEVGFLTFGNDRYLNQALYTSREWRRLRHDIIVRDEACDLGVEGYEIHSDLIIHHMNPIVKDDIIHRNDDVFNPEFLITTTLRTHNAIHYGDETLLPRPFVERRPGDTKLW